jgi:NADPH:quinone reductase-like Zn-dependent oxidoreductase
MRAAVVKRYGAPEVVEVIEVSAPGSPKADEVIVRVLAAPVTSGDARIRGARFPPGFAVPARLALGLRGPRRRVLGNSFAGVIDRVGSNATGLKVGDAVCGMVGVRMGTHAEMLTAPAAKVVKVPDGVELDQAAAALFGGTTALYFLRDKAEVGPGTSVLINGASGAVGTAAVQIAKNMGATVTGVTSARNAALVRSLGAEHVIDYTSTDIRSVPQRFDVVFDTVGSLPTAVGRNLLVEGGVMLLGVASLRDTIWARGPVRSGTSGEKAADFETVLEMVRTGDLTVVIDEVLPLEQIVEAHRRVDSGRKVGNLLIHP